MAAGILHQKQNRQRFLILKGEDYFKKKIYELKNVRSALNHKMKKKIELSGCTLQWNGLTICGSILQSIK